jgi:hypothetical protein
VDFTDLNKACPKDSFPSPRIDLLVDSMSEHQLLILWMLSWGIIRYTWTSLIKRRLRSLRIEDSTATR